MTPAPALEVALLIYDIHELYNKGALMLTLPIDFASLILAFAPLFSKRVFSSVQVLVVGAILAPRKRTITAILRVMGLSGAGDAPPPVRKSTFRTTIAFSTERFGQVLLLVEFC